MAISSEELSWLYTALKKIEFLSLCSIGEIETLVEHLSKKHFKKGDTIVREGERGDFLFLLYAGEVSIRAKGMGFGKEEIARLGPGNYLGEMSLVTFEPRSATVVATQDTDAFLLFSTDFHKLVENNQDLAQRLEQLVTKRKAEKETQLRKKYAEKSFSFWGRLKRKLGF
ncbi:MAG TPA: cyclic nucleotide-binding domain-containing protein [Elusimicrobiota bacterium]|nr:cyclic nucleotide-binding domain-containing protein [Elusimicrobiota bacterium]